MVFLRGGNDEDGVVLLSNVTPLRREMPCASGWVVGVPVEIHVGTDVARAAVALHELHDLAERGLCAQGDPLLAVAEAADILAERLHDEAHDAHVAISVGAALSGRGRTALHLEAEGDAAFVIRSGSDHVVIGTACLDSDGRRDVATATSTSAAASVRVARRALRSSGRLAALGLRTGSVVLVKADGTVSAG